MPKMKHRILLFFLFFTLGTQVLFGQDGDRPKIGLVLSGGGAKGMAHVGVLKAMEKAGLTPDYITGTSMGSIVGGLYSIGYSADELETIIKNANWDELLSNDIPLDKVTIEEKKFYSRYIIEFPMDGLKIGLPKGLIEGQAIYELFLNLTRPVHHIRDFKNLPTPFLCVGADIGTGEPVKLDTGSLAMAMRASMAIPSFFTPVHWGDHLLVDGGLVRNFPVQEIIEMGADIVIGVFVSRDLTPADEINSMVDILSQSTFVMSALDSRKQIAMCDIYIEPDLEGYSTASFLDGDSIIARGEKAGEEFYQTFKDLADSLKSISPLHEVQKIQVRDTFKINNIDVLGNENIPDEFVIGKLRIEKGEIISIDAIEERINVLHGTRYFTKIGYELIPEDDHFNMIIHTTESPTGAVKFAVHYDSENDAGINVNLTQRNFLLPASRFIFEVDFAVNQRALFNYFKYLGVSQNYAIVLNSNYDKFIYPYYDERGRQLAQFKSSYFNYSLLFQRTSSRNKTYGIELLNESSTLKPVIGDSANTSFDKLRYLNHSLSGFYRRNSINKMYFPTSGSTLNLEVKGVFSSDLNMTTDIPITPDDMEDMIADNFISSYIDWQYFYPLSKRFTIFLRTSMVLSNLPGDKFNITDFSYIGGFNPRYSLAQEYWGVNDLEFISSNYSYGKLGLQYNFIGKWYLSGLINYIDSEYPMSLLYPEYDQMPFGGKDRRWGGGFSLGLETVLGPISVSIARDEYRDEFTSNLAMGFYF